MMYTYCYDLMFINCHHLNFSNVVPKHLYGNLPSCGAIYSLDSSGQSEESDHSRMATDNEDCLYP